MFIKTPRYPCFLSENECPGIKRSPGLAALIKAANSASGPVELFTQSRNPIYIQTALPQQITVLGVGVGWREGFVLGNM